MCSAIICSRERRLNREELWGDLKRVETGERLNTRRCCQLFSCPMKKKILYMPEKLIKETEEIWHEKKFKSWSEAIRYLIQRGIDAEKEKQKK